MFEKCYRDISLRDDQDYEPLRGVLDSTGLIEVTYSDFSDLKKGEFITVVQLATFMTDRELTLTMSIAY